METRYFGNWNCFEDMARDFNEYSYGKPRLETLPDVTDENILFAAYDTPDYEGYAFVLFKKGNQLYEVHGSHCSCYGLEGQWSPEETTLEALKMRESGYTCSWYDHKEWKELLSELEQ